MYCPHCRTVCDQSANFCHRCGGSLPKASETHLPENFQTSQQSEGGEPCDSFLAEMRKSNAEDSQQSSPINNNSEGGVQEAPRTDNATAIKPYPWNSVITWMIVGFFVGMFVVHAPYRASDIDKLAIKIVSGIELGGIFGIVSGIYRYFCRE